MRISVSTNSLLSVLIIAVVAFVTQSCLFDPWPEPGGSESTFDQSDADTDADSDADVDADSDADTEMDTDTSSMPDTTGFGNTDLIFVSAPDDAGQTTVVGIAEAFEIGTEILIENAKGQEVTVPRYANGSFAGRIESDPGAPLLVSAVAKGWATEPVKVIAGTLEGAPIGDGIVDPLTVPAPNKSGLVYLHGEFDGTWSNLLVIGGNLTLSVGSSAKMNCTWGDCLFDLYIPAAPFDEVDLFLVREDQNAGHTDVQTITIPSS